MKKLISGLNYFRQLKKLRKTIPPVPEKIWQDVRYFTAFGLGSGAMPFAPGTFASLFAIPFYLLLRPLSLGAYLTSVMLFIIFSSWLSGKISREIAVHDHPGMCIDEFAGFFVTMINAPHHWQYIVLGFVLFRLFDIWKPGPIGWIDKNIHGGIGMILDDVAAGILAMIIIQIVSKIL